MSNSPEPASAKQRHRLSISIPLILVLAISFSSCNTLKKNSDKLVHDSAASPKFASAHDDEFKYCPIESVRQPSSKSCGLAALASVMQYWEHDVDVEALEEKYPAESDNGYPLLQLRRIAIKEGMMALAVTMKDRPLDQISEQLENGRPIIAPVLLPHGRYFNRDLPAVGHLDATTGTHKHHYVVLFGQSEDKFLLMDPAYGIVKISKSEFTSYWSGEKNAALLCSSF